MEDYCLRPDSQDVASAYDRLFHLSVSLSKLRDSAFGGRLFGNAHRTGSLGIAGRSIAWKLFLIPTVPLTAPEGQVVPRPPIEALSSLRKEYALMLLEKLRAPDGSYEEACAVPGVPDLPRSSDGISLNLQHHNPLSLHEDNPWKEWFTAVDLRKTIRQDVERTFPDIGYFRDPEVQSQLTHILFLHSVMHPDIGYRQGMHELLAPLFFAVDYDSLQPDAPVDPELANFCSRTWVTADAWALFTVVMEGVRSWYEWREPDPPSLLDSFKDRFRHVDSEGRVDIKPYVAPIVIACQKLQSEMLKVTDPVLWRSMQKAGTEPQIYGIRWLRLLFTREFTLADAMFLWDGIFSYEHTFQIVPWICIAMLIRVRNQLIPADYTGQLSFLLRYPAPPVVVDASCPHHTVLLLRQAFAICTAPNASAGATIAMENRNVLGIPVEIPEPRISSGARRNDQMPDKETFRNRSSSDAPHSEPYRATQRPRPQQHSPQLGLPELLARGLLEKGESLGINKTVMNAVSEFRKNIPELANQLMRSPTSSSPSYRPLATVQDKSPEERPPWEHKTYHEMERQISELISLQKQLGEAVGLAVDALLQDEGEDQGADVLNRIRTRKREAIESLAHVRDLLRGSTKEIDEERLYGEEGHQRRRSPPSQQSAHLSLPPPRQPEPVAAARPTTFTEHRRQRSSPAMQIQSSHPLKPILRAQQHPQSVNKSPGKVQSSSRRADNVEQSQDSNRAPWNYTKSNFSATSVNSALLPQPPPPTSQRSQPSARTDTPYKVAEQSIDVPVPAPTQAKDRSESIDPLGAISS